MQCYGQTCKQCLKNFGTESLVSIIDSLTIKIFVNKSPMVIQHVHYIASAPFQSVVLFFLNTVKYRLHVWFRRRDRAGSVVRLVLGHRIKGICCLLLWCLYSNCCGGLSYFITLCTAKYGANTKAANDPSVFTIRQSRGY